MKNGRQKLEKSTLGSSGRKKGEEEFFGAVHILRQPPEGGEGVSQMLTIADEGVVEPEKNLINWVKRCLRCV